MKALTIWQPWASLLATGAKRYETRSWPTKYRGPIAIHAAKRNIFTSLEEIELQDAREIHKALHIEQPIRIRDGWETLPTGCVIAVGELVNCWHIVHNPGLNVDEARFIPVGAESMTEDKHAPDFGDYFVPTEQEMTFGNWTPGNYAWEIANVRLLPKPVPATGRQGLWDWRALVLYHKGRDNWDRPVYEDEDGRIWKDVDPLPDRPPKLCTALYNAFDGEPDTPMAAMKHYEGVTPVFEPKRDTWKRRTT